MHLGSSLCIHDVRDCALRLDALLAAGGCELDAGELSNVDTAGLQLLLAAALEARRRGLTLKLLGAERLCSGAASALGLAGHLTAAAQLLP
jgi:ABC-type transporter Mla MlaB component